ncbi:WW domain containing protein, putative [Trypanosoma equiperdum]|uniref:WW domain-containing protein n=4 Tax=Trypanozoon TaxID=39700 RepID=Q581S3_TRYB2|nr:hypothetical protein, conserved [Trypanosoma brucei gambiense DAL972]XP_844308.1 hypothetical protein, conserved [Trypanosoma brucei brucei TREU927]AAX79897.1 hypothetical protein, conserved [Trypanosoma brucei]RHW73129.1 WW domain containing protein [Trypanosoma brucei equiperdum]SCU67561.1 WW domain containing protein, putative [Trypanosoma equiperdum]AAZ10749.1 hypothetical protein, conserved [Trypanosoma brucei brucei TREU927]CBH10439.1 hypothetical protein, conserved [Trypanosoma bruc|eukprot:XP_011772729.1 hypothetical protein, conserved [Trypanosoma brucei gambiense DAL972]
MSRGERGVAPAKRLNRRKRGVRRRRNRAQTKASIPAVHASFACHICSKNHWTVSCPRLRLSPRDYPLMDREKGCWKCAQRGHSSAQCQVKKYRCSDCGGLHDTRDCEFDHKSEEWHEFFDSTTQHVFYCNSETGEVQWTPPTHKLDVVLWFCSNCSILLPTSVPECVKCRVPRPHSKVSDAASSSSSSVSESGSDDGSDDEGSESASDN